MHQPAESPNRVTPCSGSRAVGSGTDHCPLRFGCLRYRMVTRPSDTFLEKAPFDNITFDEQNGDVVAVSCRLLERIGLYDRVRAYTGKRVAPSYKEEERQYLKDNADRVITMNKMEGLPPQGSQT